MAPRPPKEDDDDFITTISDADDVPAESESELEAPSASRKRKRDGAVTNGDKKRQKKGAKVQEEQVSSGEDDTPHVEDDGAMDSEFEFEIGGGLDHDIVEEFDAWDGNAINEKRGDKKGVDIDELVAKRRALEQKKSGKAAKKDQEDDKSDEDSEPDGLELSEDDEMEDIANGDGSDQDELLEEDAFGMGASLGMDDADEDEDGEGDDSSDEEAEDDDSVASPMAHPDDVSDAEQDDPEERAREEAFFAPEQSKTTSKTKLSSSFQAMSLSRPILRGLAALNFSDPTPIQAKTIPVALLGKDIVGGAVTGSGKTGAFMIPILERLLYRPRKVPTTRVVILMPTRELAVQCYNVARKLASFTDITFAQIVGGLSLREQEGVLRRRPDVVIATTGRFIDHMRNSAAFAVDSVEILVLDEADRMLEDGFADELNEILTTIPRGRQTMLFSATMTSRVDQLIRVGLQKPVRLLVDAQRQTVGSLAQEFVRLRAGREDKRLAYLMQLVTTVYTARCIVFFRQKKEAHRVRIVFSLCDIKAAELHGSMSQEQRLAAVEAFRAGTVTHLLATDVASRGLDIRGVDSVLNYEAPQTHAIYLHRVGRTARMGRAGRACTLAAEEDRKVVREVVKGAKEQGAKVSGRNVDAAAIDQWVNRLDELQTEIQAVMEDEQEARAMAQADMQLKKGENMIKHAEEIASRPKRTWFATETEKAAAKKKGRAELNGEVNGKDMTVVGKKISNKERKREALKQDRKEAGNLFKKSKEDRGSKRGGGNTKNKKPKGGRAEGRHKMKMQKGKKGKS